MSKLREELDNIRDNIERTDQRMAEIEQDWINAGGICCPSYYSEEYSLLLTKQERREERILQIKAKLGI